MGLYLSNGQVLDLEKLSTSKLRFKEQLTRKDIRTKGCKLYSYIIPFTAGHYTQYKVPITWATSAERTTINSWWMSGATLSLSETKARDQQIKWDNGIQWSSGINWSKGSERVTDVKTVMIVGKKEALRTSVEPYFNIFFSGRIVLETI